MKIGIDIRHLATTNPSGVGLYTIALIEMMAKKAPTDEFFLFAAGNSQGAMNRAPTAKNVHFVRINWPNKILSLAFISGRLTLEDLMPVKLDAWWFPNLNVINTKLPYSITAHDLSFQFYPEFLTTKAKLWHKIVAPRKLYSQAKAILSVSQSTKRDLIRTMNLPAEKIIVTKLGYNEKLYQFRQQPADNQFRRSHGINFPYFLSLCTLEPRKNLLSVIDGYENWCQQSVQPVPHLVIAGAQGWMTKPLRRAVASSWFRDQIHLIGYVPEKHKGALYRGANALIFPSFYEGFGLPVLEAMACGAPVIASFTSSLPEIVGDSGLLVDPYRAGDISQALTTISNSTNLELLRSRGLTQAKNFSWDKTAQITLEAIHQMC